MAWLVCGTIPDPSLPLGWQTLAYDIEEGCLIGDADFARLHVQRGTPTLYAACLLACRVLGVESPRALFVGDIGDGVGSAALYAELCARLSPNADEFSGITFHYLFPDLDGHNRVLASLEGHARRPMLVADAGFMYAAKMSGYTISLLRTQASWPFWQTKTHPIRSTQGAFCWTADMRMCLPLPKGPGSAATQPKTCL